MALGRAAARCVLQPDVCMLPHASKCDTGADATTPACTCPDRERLSWSTDGIFTCAGSAGWDEGAAASRRAVT